MARSGDRATTGGTPESSSRSDTGRAYWGGVARIGIQTAQALAYAAAQGTLHRDVKPSNLLLDGRGNLWVTDFGLAKAADSEDLTHTGDIVGTLRYMAPERFSGKGDLRSDLYSLGLTLYELLALRPAFEAPDRQQLVHQVLHAEPPRLRQLDRSIPRDLETIIHKAIDKDPARRYQTAEQLADDLQRFLDDRPIRARRVGAVEKLWRWRGATRRWRGCRRRWRCCSSAWPSARPWRPGITARRPGARRKWRPTSGRPTPTPTRPARRRTTTPGGCATAWTGCTRSTA